MKKLLLLLFVGLAVVSCKKDDDASLSLDMPTSVDASSSFSLKVELTWGDVSNAEGYNIYRADDIFEDPEGLDYELIGTTDTNSYDDLSVESSSAYYYQIEAFSGSTTSDLSAPVAASTTTITADEAFDVLAEYTGGRRYDAASANDVPNIIIDVINEQAVAGTDLVFLIDNTGSMSDDIAQVKAALTDIISNLPPNNRLAMAVYNDANEDPDGWYEWFDLTEDYSQAQMFLDDISVYGGGDFPESVYDGIYNTVDFLSWGSDTKRMMLVIGDAPPLEGSLTVRTLSEVVDICNDMEVVANLYPILIND